MNGQEIYHILKREILTLKLRPGQMISENEIANHFNVSRTPVKAAFNLLAGDDLLEIIPQKGTFVTLIDCKHIRDILYMRYVLEADMCKLAINSPPYFELIEKLEQNLEVQANMIKQADLLPESYYELDTQFHALLFESLGYDGIWSVIQANQVHYPRFRLLDTHMFGRYEELKLQHSDILNALKNKDVKRVDQCIYHHLHQYLILLSKSPSDDYKDFLLNWHT